MLRGVAGQDVAAADTALGAHQPGTLEGEQDLLEVRLGQAGALGDVAHRRRPRLVGVQGERQQRSAGIVTSGRDAHSDNLRRWTVPSRSPEWRPELDASELSALDGCERSERCASSRLRATRRRRGAAVTACVAGERNDRTTQPIIPDYLGANVRGIIPALLGPGDWARSLPAWFPEPVRHARQVVAARSSTASGGTSSSSTER